MKNTAVRDAMIEAGVNNPTERIRREFFKCVSANRGFRWLFVKPPTSERTQEKLIYDYQMFATWYNSGSKSVNNYTRPEDIYRLPEDFLEIAQLFGFRNTNISGAWSYLVHLLNEEWITWIYSNKKELTIDLAIHGTLALVKVVLDSKDENEKRKILGLVRDIQKWIGGNLKAVKNTGDMSELEYLTERIQRQLSDTGVEFDEYEIIQIIKKILPSIT